MFQLSPYLPPGDGMLPKWLLFVSLSHLPMTKTPNSHSFSLQVGTVAIGNSMQAYTTLHYTQRLYNGSTPTKSNAAPVSPVTPLSARTFGTWTILQGIVRSYAAYNIHDKSWYTIALGTYMIAAAHFLSEWLVYRSASWNKTLAAPVFISSGTIVWMLLQWNHYVV